ncbi:MAG: ribonuclease D, partial [Actinomycetota bacterium]|nr:ribonuclease D [Actinomycetota bacterium]
MEISSPPRVEREPRDGVPHIITTPEALEHYASALTLGQGPVALDAERASGFRYSQRAYLIQVR